MDFCHALQLEANLGNGDIEYTGDLTGFTYEAGEFFETENWKFIASLPDDNPEFENKTCNFKFIFEGVQLGPCTGFWDIEEIENTIISAQFEPYVVINKVYYDVDDEHGTEEKNEWIELYNPTDKNIDIKKWEICNNSECKVINKQVSVPAFGYALLSHDNTTWTKYWDAPDYVETINLGTAPEDGWLGNDADMLILQDNYGNIIDQMNWGTPDAGWVGVWNPGCPDVEEGHMVSDWKDLGLPEVTVLYPNGGEQWLIVPPHWAHLWFGIYPISWEAFNFNGPDEDLKIDIWFCNNHGNNCFYKIVDDTDNDGEYEWTIPYDQRFVGADIKIKIVAEGPENFMVQAWDKSDNEFCPPLLSEAEVLEMLLLEMIKPSEELSVEEIPVEEIFDEGINDEEIPPEETFEEIISDTEVPDTSIINDNTFVGISAPSIEDAVDEIEDGDCADAETYSGPTPVNFLVDEVEDGDTGGDFVDEAIVDNSDQSSVINDELDTEVPDTSIINNNTFVGISAPSVEDAVAEVEDCNDDATSEETPETPDIVELVEPEQESAPEPVSEPEPVIEPEPVDTPVPASVEPPLGE
jgi:hypothetical protein